MSICVPVYLCYYLSVSLPVCVFVRLCPCPFVSLSLLVCVTVLVCLFPCPC